jgi:hypothetical protein
MPEDQLLDSINVIGEGIHAINLRLANMLPVAGFNELKKKRNDAQERQDFLIKLFIKNSTSRFIAADSELAVVNEEMQKTLDELEDMQQVLDSVTTFVASIDKFIGAISLII